MGLFKENPRYNIISARISDEEKSTLDKISRQTKKSVSLLMREALQLCYTENRGLSTCVIDETGSRMPLH